MSVRLARMAAFSRERIAKFRPRHRRPAGPPGLRAGAVCLSGQPFPQPRARQYLDGGAGRRPLLPHHVLAIPPGGDRVLHRGAGASGLGIWALYQRRQFRWKAIEPLQLVLGLSIPALIIAHIAGVRLGQALFGQEKPYPQVFYAYWVRLAVQDVADVCGPAHRLGPRLHRALFLAADEGVLQARGAVSARRRGPDSDARPAGPLSGRAQRRRRQRPAPNGGRTISRRAMSARRPNRTCSTTSPTIS